MSIQDEPHYELPSAELAAWIEQQGTDRWWGVHGDWLLTGRMIFPCPGDELAEELRRINRPLLMLDKNQNPDARGQLVGRQDLDALVSRSGDDVAFKGPRPAWADGRLMYLCWKDRLEEWMLVEDLEGTELARRDAELARENP